MWTLQVAVFAGALLACSGLQERTDWLWKSRAARISENAKSSRLHLHSASHAEFPMSESGFRAVAALNDEAAMKNFIYRRVQDVDSVVKDPKTFEMFLAHAYQRREQLTLRELTGMLERAPWGLAKARAKAPHLQNKTELLQAVFPMSESGWQAVVALNDEAVMKTFIYRRVRDLDSIIENPKMFDMFIAHMYQRKGKLTFDELTAMLERAPWGLVKAKAKTAPLTQDGYQEVARLKNESQMMVYAQRVLAANDKHIPLDELKIPYEHGGETIATFAVFQSRLLGHSKQ